MGWPEGMSWREKWVWRPCPIMWVISVSGIGFRRLPGADHVSGSHDADPIAHLHGFSKLVRDHKNAEALSRELAQRHHEVGDFLRHQHRGRFVENQDVGRRTSTLRISTRCCSPTESWPTLRSRLTEI